MLGRLNLTSQESAAFVLEDEGDDNLDCPEWAVVGKVLNPNPLHISTIKTVLGQAWGNPRGLEFRSLGTNIFLAEFANQFDRDRVLGGSPWHISKHGVLLKFFDPLVKPSEVIFDRLSLWARIFKLPFGLMNDTRGKELAGNLGKVEAMDVDSKGRAWGDFLRVRVAINVLEPVMRCVSVFSQKRKTKEIFQVMYERLPIYCFSCGLIGHSSLVCPTPGERTADGLLPYHGSLVCVPEDKKKKGSGAQFGQSPYASNRSEPGSGQCGHNPVHASQQGADGFGE
jgi:hypothetical protein